MTSPTFIRPTGFVHWCRYRSAVSHDRITTVCRASIAQGEPLELADEIPEVDHCTACEATLQAWRERGVSADTLAELGGEVGR